MHVLNAAIKIATEAHEGQFRKHAHDEGLPYIVHPLEVMTLVRHAGCSNATVLAACVLHDVIEDTDCDAVTLTATMTKADIAAPVIGAVLEMVLPLTLPVGVTGEQKHGVIMAMLSDENVPVEARGIKMADRMSNLRTLLDVPWSRGLKRKYAEDAIEIAALSSLTAESLPPDLMWIDLLAVNLNDQARNAILTLDREAEREKPSLN